ARSVLRAQRCLRRAQPLCPARRDDDVEALGGKDLGERLADAGRPAGDERDPSTLPGASVRLSTGHARFGATACCTLKMAAASAAPMHGPTMYSQPCAIDPCPTIAWISAGPRPTAGLQAPPEIGPP